MTMTLAHSISAPCSTTRQGPAARQAAPGELLCEFYSASRKKFYRIELRDRGAYGVEAQVLDPVEMVFGICSRRVNLRSPGQRNNGKRLRKAALEMTTRQRLAWAPLLLCLTACRDKHEAEFRLKEACFASATKFFQAFVEKTGAELTETFYSSKRNSCICETRRQPIAKSGPLIYELHDCLSIERLGETKAVDYPWRY